MGKASMGFYTLAIPNETSLGVRFNVPQVCVDAQNRPLKIDPTSSLCTKRRKLRIGEPLLWYRMDRAWNRNYLVNMNIPFLKGSKLRIINVRDWGINAASPQEPRNFFDADYYKGGDGYDIVEMDGNYTSAVGTRDPITTDGAFRWYNASCAPEDGWIFFDNGLPKNLAQWVVARLTGATSAAQCASAPKSDSLTIYHWYSENPWVFSSGRRARTISSWNYGAGRTDEDLNHLERFYFTEEFGMTRWERWETREGCKLSAAFHGLDPAICTESGIRAQIDANKRSQDCNGNHEEMPFNQYMYRGSCRDWTQLAYFSQPQQPYLAPLSSEFASLRNLLKEFDFAEGKMTAWQKYDGTKPASLATIQKVRDGSTGNYRMRVSSSDGGIGHSTYQDIDPRATVADLGTGDLVVQMGARLQSSQNGRVTIVAFLISPTGQMIGDRRMHITFPNKEDHVVAFHFPWNFTTQPVGRIRYQIYFDRPGDYELDDAFLTVLPRR